MPNSQASFFSAQPKRDAERPIAWREMQARLMYNPSQSLRKLCVRKPFREPWV